MKNILAKIEFHYTFLIMAIGLVLTGHFANLLVFTSLILIHETGHFLTSIIFKYKVDKIIIYPYGGITKLNTMINTNIGKDLLIAISGTIVQSIYFIIIIILFNSGIIREYIYNLFLLYHNSMLLFNLLPVLPLDGSKIISLILAKFLNFNLANNLTVFISLITIIILLISKVYENNYSLLLSLGILMQNIYKFYKEISYIYNRFLLERYLYNFNYKKNKVINNKDKMYKNRIHFFYKNGIIQDEKAYLKDFFNKKH
ncbi:MAG: hypothetical protein IJZ46_02540 [Bacilli bacterium]|nr:hypothetical protein [Bacilli bacterium]